MRGGQNIVSIEDHKAKGNYRPSRHKNRVETIVKGADTIPEPPDNYDKKHKEFWVKTCESLKTLGLLQTVDTDQINVYVINWFLWRDASDSLIEDGFVITVETEKGVRQIKNPAEIVMRNSERTLITLGDKFGFNPRARMGIKTDPQEEKDPFADFLKKNN